MTNRLRMNFNRASNTVENRPLLRENAQISRTKMYNSVSRIQEEKCRMFKEEVEQFQKHSPQLFFTNQRQFERGQEQPELILDGGAFIRAFSQPTFNLTNFGNINTIGQNFEMGYDAFPNSDNPYALPVNRQQDDIEEGDFMNLLRRLRSQNLRFPLFQSTDMDEQVHRRPFFNPGYEEFQQPQRIVIPPHLNTYVDDDHDYYYENQFMVEEEIDEFYEEYQEDQALQDWHDAFGLENPPDHYIQDEHSSDFFYENDEWENNIGPEDDIDEFRDFY